MKRIETKDLGKFVHDRFEFWSDSLGRREKFSLVRPKDVKPKATIYYFHAGNTDDRMLAELQLLERMDHETRDLLVARGVQFALPNFGLNFLLSASDDPRRGFQEYFFDEVMKLAEEGTDTDAPSRFLSGASLGGHSVLVAFLRHPELFKGVASTIGALLDFDFYDPQAFSKYVSDGGLSTDFATNLKQIFLGCFETYDLYKKVDPHRLLNQVPQGALEEKRILIETGSSDDFGFHIGMSDFSDALTKRKILHRFELVDGGRHEPAFVMSRFSPMLRFLLN